MGPHLGPAWTREVCQDWGSHGIAWRRESSPQSPGVAGQIEEYEPTSRSALRNLL
jgi:hypothetical protein